MKEPTVLIIDDSEFDRYILKRQLQEEGIEAVFEQDDGSSALAFFEDHEFNKTLYDGSFPPTVIFLDINMPNTNGFEFLEKFAKIRKNVDATKTIIMMLSSSDLIEEKEKALKYDFVKDYIVKGTQSPKQIVKKIAKLMLSK